MATLHRAISSISQGLSMDSTVPNSANFSTRDIVLENSMGKCTALVWLFLVASPARSSSFLISGIKLSSKSLSSIWHSNRHIIRKVRYISENCPFALIRLPASAESMPASTRPMMTRATAENVSEVSSIRRMIDGVYSASTETTRSTGTLPMAVNTRLFSYFHINLYMYATQESIPYFGLRFFSFFSDIFLSTFLSYFPISALEPRAPCRLWSHLCRFCLRLSERPLALNLVLFYHMASKKLHSDYEMQFSVNEMSYETGISTSAVNPPSSLSAVKIPSYFFTVLSTLARPNPCRPPLEERNRPPAFSLFFPAALVTAM